MGAWSSIVKAFSNLFKGGGGAVAGGAASSAIANGGKVILTWGNTIKVAVVGGFTYLFLNGGASNVVATTLGIPEGVAQVLIILVFVVLLILALRYLVNYARDKVGLKKEYLQDPIIQRRGPSSPPRGRDSGYGPGYGYDGSCDGPGCYDGYGRYDQRVPDSDWDNRRDHWRNNGGGGFR